MGSTSFWRGVVNPVWGMFTHYDKKNARRHAAQSTLNSTNSSSSSTTSKAGASSFGNGTSDSMLTPDSSLANLESSRGRLLN